MADIDRLRRLAYQIAQEAKEIQNTTKPWSDEQWRVLSRAIERLEEKTRPDDGH